MDRMTSFKIANEIWQNLVAVRVKAFIFLQSQLEHNLQMQSRQRLPFIRVFIRGHQIDNHGRGIHHWNVRLWNCGWRDAMRSDVRHSDRTAMRHGDIYEDSDKPRGW